MKQERDALALAVSKAVWDLRDASCNDSATALEQAFYNVCEAERAWQSWVDQVTVAASHVTHPMHIADAEKQSLFVLRANLYRLKGALDGVDEPTQLPESRGPYR